MPATSNTPRHGLKEVGKEGFVEIGFDPNKVSNYVFGQKCKQGSD